MPVSELFVTRFMRDSLTALPDWQELNTELEQACLSIAEDDEAGREWCEQNGYDGYTSYASLDDLHTRAPAFARLKPCWRPMQVPMQKNSTGICAALRW